MALLVQNTGQYIRHIGVRLVPGVNRLLSSQEDAFNKARQHPLNNYLITSGEIRILEGNGNQPPEFHELSAVQAIDLAKDTFDLELLEEFKNSEEAHNKRSTVLKAITAQIDEINNGDGADEQNDPDEKE